MGEKRLKPVGKHGDIVLKMGMFEGGGDLVFVWMVGGVKEIVF